MGTRRSCPWCVSTRGAAPRGPGPRRAEQVWLPRQEHRGEMRPWRRGIPSARRQTPGAAPRGCTGRRGLGLGFTALVRSLSSLPPSLHPGRTPPQAGSPGPQLCVSYQPPLHRPVCSRDLHTLHPRAPQDPRSHSGHQPARRLRLAASTVAHTTRADPTSVTS